MYSGRLMDHYRRPRNAGRLEAPDAAAEEYNPLCGDRVLIEARLDAGQVVAARFSGQGCALCLGAASILAEWIEGRRLDDLRAMNDEAFLAQLDAYIPAARLRCALLPWAAFRRAAWGEAGLPGALESE
jgi:nitrogen fixation NifU-like protein